jgi:hypothetical protein
MMCDYRGPQKGVKWLSHQGQCKACREEAWANHVVPSIVFGAVPGGTTKTSVAKAQSRQFEKDMDAYKRAVDNGLDPEQVSAAAVEKEERRLYGTH